MSSSVQFSFQVLKSFQFGSQPQYWLPGKVTLLGKRDGKTPFLAARGTFGLDTGNTSSSCQGQGSGHVTGHFGLLAKKGSSFLFGFFTLK